MAFEVSTDRAICFKCGKAFSKYRGYFPASYAVMHRGLGFAPICKDCLDKLYDSYLVQCNDTAMAVRQVCRKLDLYWDAAILDQVMKKSSSTSIMSQYLQRLTLTKYVGKSYDDTLSIEGTLWDFSTYAERHRDTGVREEAVADAREEAVEDDPDDMVDESVVLLWGPGYTPKMYRELEQRRAYWLSKLPEGSEHDIGTEALLRQICPLELDINRERAAGNTVDKSVNTLNTLLGSLNLKPVQKKQDEVDQALGSTPLGVWLYRYENKRPLPDTYDDSPILKYVFTWLGHVCRMLGIKGSKYTKLYEDALMKYRVEKPEYHGDDEDLMLEELESADDTHL